MTEREALLRAVCENPDDDTPRLVFADWLDENGEPERAEFIRAQIAACRAPENGPERKSRDGVAKRLLRRNEDRWRAELASLPGALDWWGFHRGFFEHLSVRDGSFSSQDAERILSTEPVRHLQLIHTAFVKPFVPFAKHVVELHVPGHSLTSEDVAMLCDSGHLIKATALTLFACSRHELDERLCQQIDERFGDKCYFIPF